MSRHSHGWERRLDRIGLPFWRCETKIAEPKDFVGKAWGVGCTTLGPVVDDVVGGRGSRRWGIGWVMRGREVMEEVSVAAKAARKSGSAPNSSSSSIMASQDGVDEVLMIIVSFERRG